MKKFNTLFHILIILLFTPLFGHSQIQVLEAENSDSTRYSSGSHQDSVYIVYKGSNGKSSITLFADLNNIDSLNFEWFKYNNNTKKFEVLMRSKSGADVDTIVRFDSVINCLVPPENLTDLMEKYEGGYQVRIHNEQKGIDTVFTVWVWYQTFFINKILPIRSTCTDFELKADHDFEPEFSYYDLSVEPNELLSVKNEVTFTWTTNPGEETDRKYGSQVVFNAPVEPTTYAVTALDKYNHKIIVSNFIVDETELDKFGYPYLRAVKPEFKGIHGPGTAEDASDSTVRVEAPHGVAFYNTSQNAELYEWVFYNHPDWRSSTNDTALKVSDLFDFRIDSIYYKYPPKDTLKSKVGYDVKLKVWGPYYNSDNERCFDSIRKIDFVVVSPTKFPQYIEDLPNVFTPNGTYDRFYFMSTDKKASEDVKSIKYFSIKIYNRWGNKVYEFEDEDGSWIDNGGRGWDGTTRVGTKAKPGVYYYTILGTGWDNREFEVGGYVHVF